MSRRRTAGQTGRSSYSSCRGATSYLTREYVTCSRLQHSSQSSRTARGCCCRPYPALDMSVGPYLSAIFTPHAPDVSSRDLQSPRLRLVLLGVCLRAFTCRLICQPCLRFSFEREPSSSYHACHYSRSQTKVSVRSLLSLQTATSPPISLALTHRPA